MSSVWNAAKGNTENRQIAFAIPTYGFNITSDGSLKGLTEEDINIGTFPGIKTDKVIFFG